MTFNGPDRESQHEYIFIGCGPRRYPAGSLGEPKHGSESNLGRFLRTTTRKVLGFERQGASWLIKVMR